MEGIWILLLAVHIVYPCAAISQTKTYHEQLVYGQQLSIKLPVGAEKLEFISVDESQKDVLWSRFVLTRRGIVSGTDNQRSFTIYSVTFEDQGMYTLLDFWNKKISIHLVKVTTKLGTQNCVAGESLQISLGGISSKNATLHFSSQDYNITLVERGSPVGNSHPDYMGRIKVSGTSIEVLNVNVSDVGNYTLSDHRNRKVKIISMNLVDHHEGVNAAPLMGLLMLLGIPPCIFCCCRKKICKNSSQTTATPVNTTTTVHFDNQINPPGPPPAYVNPAAPAIPTTAYTPGYPAVGESTVHPPPNPTYPLQPPYNGYPATSPAVPPNPAYTPGYPTVGESTVHPPPNPTYPLQPHYNGYPATSPTVPPNPAFNPGYPPASPQWSGAPYNQPASAGLSPMMYNAPAGPEPSKGEITLATPLLTPPQPEVAQPPALHAGPNVLNSSDSAVQFNINMEKDSSSNFL